MLHRLSRHGSLKGKGGGKGGDAGRMLQTLEDSIHNPAHGGSGRCEIEMSDTSDTISDTCRGNSLVSDNSGGGVQGQSTAVGGSGGNTDNGSSSSSSSTCCKGVLKRRVVEAGLRQSMR
jgi:hypothetical protein